MSRETLALVISGLALLASIWSVVETRRASNRDLKLQERMLRLESGRELERRIAGLKAQLVAFVDVSGNRLYLRNHGQATAQNIEVMLDGLPLGEHQLATRSERYPDTLGAAAEAGVRLLRYDGRQDTIRVALTWRDESGERGQWESDLSLP
jgi:hypothetical protein